MTPLTHPFRSVLYMPGANSRALAKAENLPADAIIFDLEDAVSIDDKARARDQVVQAIANGTYGRRSLIVRINGFETNWAAADIAAVCAVSPPAILLPKVNSDADIRQLANMLDTRPNCRDTAIWAMMETPQGILNAHSIATSSPRLQGLVLGTNDLIKDLGARHMPGRAPVMTSFGLCLLAARAAGLICLDGVYNKYRDTEGLSAECAQARDLGFDGKTLIHPSQIEAANRIFAPSDTEIDLAQRQMAAFEAAEANGKGIAVLDGVMVENLHIVSASQLLAKAAAIADMTSG